MSPSLSVVRTTGAAVALALAPILLMYGCKDASRDPPAAAAKADQIAKNFAGMENLGQQLTQLNADLNRVKTSMAKVESDTESRLKATEQDIESINVYRLQLNQTMTTLQNNVNALQQKVGQ